MVVTARGWARERDPMAYGFLKVGVLTLSLAGMGTLAVTGAVGCGDGNSGVANAKLPEGVRSQAIEHEACDESGNKVEMLDANNDGKPDIKSVSKDGREICRITDLNHDGKPDMFEYFDATGQLRRRESDYDDNGDRQLDRVLRERQAGSARARHDEPGHASTRGTPTIPRPGARIKRERDSTGDGKIDQWWTYEGDKVTIAMDRNGDGMPDPESRHHARPRRSGRLRDAGGAAPVPAPRPRRRPQAADAPMPPPEQRARSARHPAVPGRRRAGKPQRGGAKR